MKSLISPKINEMKWFKNFLFFKCLKKTHTHLKVQLALGILSITSSINCPNEKWEDPPSIKAILLLSVISFTLFLIKLSLSISCLIPFSTSFEATFIILSIIKSLLQSNMISTTKFNSFTISKAFNYCSTMAK